LLCNSNFHSEWLRQKISGPRTPSRRWKYHFDNTSYLNVKAIRFKNRRLVIIPFETWNKETNCKALRISLPRIVIPMPKGKKFESNCFTFVVDSVGSVFKWNNFPGIVPLSRRCSKICEWQTPNFVLPFKFYFEKLRQKKFINTLSSEKSFYVNILDIKNIVLLFSLLICF